MQKDVKLSRRWLTGRVLWPKGFLFGGRFLNETSLKMDCLIWPWYWSLRVNSSAVIFLKRKGEFTLIFSWNWLNLLCIVWQIKDTVNLEVTKMDARYLFSYQEKAGTLFFFFFCNWFCSDCNSITQSCFYWKCLTSLDNKCKLVLYISYKTNLQLANGVYRTLLVMFSTNLAFILPFCGKKKNISSVWSQFF